MLNFDIPLADRALVAPMHRAFQAGVATLANLKCGLKPPFRVDGIYKAEGGVVVNGKEIAIKRAWVVDDFGPRGASPAIPEETATVEAMQELIQRVKDGGDLSEFEAAEISGDNLTSFFNNV